MKKVKHHFSATEFFTVVLLMVLLLIAASTSVHANEQRANTVVADHIGSFNRVADNQPPSLPASLRSVRYSSTAGEIIWTAATDDTVVVGYRVFRDDEFLGVKDARSLYEPNLEPAQSYTYTVSAIDRQGNEGAPLVVELSGTRGEKRDARVPGTVEPPPIPDPVPDPGVDNDGLILYSQLGRVTLLEGDSAGLSIGLSVQRKRSVKRAVTLSLKARTERDMRQLRHTFSTITLGANESGSVLTLHLDVGVAPLIFHERHYEIIADDGVSRTSTPLIVDVTPTKAPDVYLLIGQSNMEGYSEKGSRQRFPGGLDARNSRIRQLNVQPNSPSIFTHDALFTDELANTFDPLFVVAEDPLHEPRYPGVGGKGATFVGLGLSFAKQALRHTNATVYLVPAAWGATGFCANNNGNLAWNAKQTPDSFLGGTLLADRALTRLNLTLRETGGVLRAILWHQGGADSNNPDCARTYEQNLSALVRRIRREARVDKRGADARGNDSLIPFIVATQSKGDDERAPFSRFSATKRQVDAAHRNIASYVQYADFVNNDDLVPPQYPCGQVSCVHFGAAALREQGRRFYVALTRIWRNAQAYHF